MLVYVAHPVAGDVQANLARAKQWLRWLYDELPEVTFVAHWLIDIEILDDANPAHRELGLWHDQDIIARCDAVLVLGPAQAAAGSRGIAREIRVAGQAGVPVVIATDRAPVPHAAIFIHDALVAAMEKRRT